MWKQKMQAGEDPSARKLFVDRSLNTTINQLIWRVVRQVDPFVGILF
jgi:hypothetical protein